MFDLPFGSNEELAAVRRPTFAINIQGNGGEANGMGVGAVSDLLGAGSADPWAAALVGIAIDIGIAPTVDVATIWLANEARAPHLAIGDSGTIALGYMDASVDASNDLIFTGQVDTVRYDLASATRLTVVNGGAKLARQRIEQSYQEQSAGAIVKELASQADVDTDVIEDGGKFPFYAIDAGRNLYQHIARLAQRNGYLASVTHDDKLAFAPPAADEAQHTFRFGVDIMANQMQQVAPLVGSVLATGEGAAGSNGTDAWSWLVKDPSSNQKRAGQSSPERAFADPGLRSGELAESASQARLGSQSPQHGMLIVPGTPAVRVGAAVEVVDAPQATMNGLFVVYRLRHFYSKQQGFSTQIYCRQAGDSGGGLLGNQGGLLS